MAEYKCKYKRNKQVVIDDMHFNYASSSIFFDWYMRTCDIIGCGVPVMNYLGLKDSVAETVIGAGNAGLNSSIAKQSPFGASRAQAKAGVSGAPRHTDDRPEPTPAMPKWVDHPEEQSDAASASEKIHTPPKTGFSQPPPTSHGKVEPIGKPEPSAPKSTVTLVSAAAVKAKAEASASEGEPGTKRVNTEPGAKR